MKQLPEKLTSELFNFFSSGEGYALYPDVEPLLLRIRESVNKAKSLGQPLDWPWDVTICGVISNSDNRIIPVMESLGLDVSPRLAGTSRERLAPEESRHYDIEFTVTSYNIGIEKPSWRAYSAAREMLNYILRDEKKRASRGLQARTALLSLSVHDFECLHIGDDMREDVVGARKAGWHSLFLSRNENHANLLKGEHRVAILDPLPGAELQYNDIELISDLGALHSWRTQRR